jgi:alanine dehydrogenase
MIILNAKDVHRALPMPQAVQAMKRAFAALTDGQAEVPLRARLSVPPYQAVSLFMPAFVDAKPNDTSQEQALAVKVVSIFPHNPERSLPLIYAATLVLEPDTGQVMAMIEGSSLTAIRTGAAAGAATDLLARQDSCVAAIFGAGAQGRTQLEGICSVRSIQDAFIYDPNPQRLHTFIREMEANETVTAHLHAAKNPTEAVAEADIVCTATTSRTPVFPDQAVKLGAHINGMGSYTAEMAEIPAETVTRARVVVDSCLSALAEAGDLIQPIQRGLITEHDTQAGPISELGEIVLERQPGRESSTQITIFKSVGNAVQDAVAAQVALQNAIRQGLGQQIEW